MDDWRARAYSGVGALYSFSVSRSAHLYLIFVNDSSSGISFQGNHVLCDGIADIRPQECADFRCLLMPAMKEFRYW